MYHVHEQTLEQASRLAQTPGARRLYGLAQLLRTIAATAHKVRELQRDAAHLRRTQAGAARLLKADALAREAEQELDRQLADVGYATQRSLLEGGR